MKRLAAIALVLVAGIALVVFATGSGGDDGYRVRAIFNNAGFAIPGMDVRVAGVVVGQIDSLDVEDKKAAIVLKIDDPAYQDFREDAFCTVRPQSLIGEKFIECRPTQPRAEDAPVPPPLPEIQDGPNAGQRLLTARQTATTVDLDLINNIMRLPYRQRFTIILNEFGTAVAGNGAELNSAIKKANPALKALDDVLAVLASQNKRLASLAKNGDTVLQPLARERDSVAGFIRTSGETAQATAEKSAELEQNIQKLPGFLEELGPTMDELGAFASAATPVVEDLGRSAGSLNELVEGTPAFAQAGIPAFKTLGETADVGGPALQASLPLVQDLGKLGKQAKPLSQDLADLTTSLRSQGAITNFLNFVFYGAGATNGYDQYGHYLRARLVLTQCQSYVTINQLACTANFNKDLGAVSAPPAGSRSSRPAAPAAPAPTAAAAPRDAIKLPKTLLPGDDGTTAGAGAAPKERRAAKPAAPDDASTQSLLDYLLGE